MTNEILEKYKDLVYSISNYFEGYKNRDDLFQAGCVGLITAYNNYNPNMGAKFSTYAYTYILGEMKKLVREDKSIKISRNITKLYLHLERAKIILCQKLMREPTLEEIAQYLNISCYELSECIGSINVVQSLDETINDDGKEISLYDVIGKSNDITDLISLREELNGLNKIDKSIIENRYLYDMTQDEVAKKLGMSQVQISRSEQKIKTRLREKLTIS